MELVFRQFTGEVPRTVPREHFSYWRLLGQFEDGKEAIEQLSQTDPQLSDPSLPNEGVDRFAIYEVKTDKEGLPKSFKFKEFRKATTPDVTTTSRKVK